MQHKTCKGDSPVLVWMTLCLFSVVLPTMQTETELQCLIYLRALYLQWLLIYFTWTPEAVVTELKHLHMVAVLQLNQTN